MVYIPVMDNVANHDQPAYLLLDAAVTIAGNWTSAASSPGAIRQIKRRYGGKRGGARDDGSEALQSHNALRATHYQKID